ncbi:hypothetical protein FIU82_06055 [Pseudoalteromonas sp. THAF3]|uniref:hypothetical protein n=1 Tax=Pseudoalteromonas sp. THAF3 TaxID=2587843 RepID=UPI00126787D1|nr:hypothetical protein [Pseudoalteromonas sp. THAF3]QFU04579.1 hypothetical protein FIU82_06055 [Pseudoalteromonas sp. THAF3]
MLSFKSNVDPLMDKLKEAGDQVPYATSLAINDVAYQSRLALQSHMARVLDAPIPFTLRGVRYDKASKRNLRALVYLRDEVARYMEAQIEGGTRDEKGLEVGLKASRLFTRNNIPRDTYFIPTKAYQTGRGGNITKAKARKILEETKRPDGKFFMFQDDRDERPLVFERMRGGKDLRLALVGVGTPKYSKRVKFEETVAETVERTFRKALDKALDKALPASD